MTTPPPDIAAIAGKLTSEERGYVTRLWPGENRMGGYGKDCGCPGLIESVGIHHPIFGAHYRLTESGLAVRALLLSKEQNDG